MHWEVLPMNKYLRRQFSLIGWVLVAFHVIMNLFVLLGSVPEIFRLITQNWAPGRDFPLEEIINIMNGSGWGYWAVSALGLGLLLSVGGLDFWKREIWQRREPMNLRTFLALLAVFWGLQLPASLLTDVINAFFRLFNRDILQVYTEMVAAEEESFSLFVYAGILAPIGEELLFRGWIQSRLRRFGRQFAMVMTALLFSLYHGNLAQIPFAFFAGLLLSYTAEHYSLAWCMVLHMMNNLVLADLLPTILSYLPEAVDIAVDYGIYGVCTIVCIVLLIKKRKALMQEFTREPMDPRTVKWFFLNPGILVMLALCVKTCFDMMYFV